MPIISVRDNENSKWKRNAKKTKQTKTEKSEGEQKLKWKGESYIILLCI